MEYLSSMPLPTLPVLSYIWVADSNYTMCNFERGGAKNLIIGGSWNNREKNSLDLHYIGT